MRILPLPVPAATSGLVTERQAGAGGRSSLPRPGSGEVGSTVVERATVGYHCLGAVVEGRTRGDRAHGASGQADDGRSDQNGPLDLLGHLFTSFRFAISLFTPVRYKHKGSK